MSISAYALLSYRTIDWFGEESRKVEVLVEYPAG